MKTEADVFASQQEELKYKFATGNFHRAVGKKMVVRLDKKTTVTGIIVKVEFGGCKQRVGVRGWQQVAISDLLFKVTMECGVAKALRTVTVSRLPE